MTKNSQDKSEAHGGKRGSWWRAVLRTIFSGANPISVLLTLLIGTMAIIGVILLAIYAWQEETWKIFVVGTLMSMATAAIASLGGFLFGLPRPNPDSGGATRPNNNLEQVSDWLTKLLLGAGLVQLGHIGRGLGKLINGLASALSSSVVEPVPPAAAKALAGSLIGFNAALGFLFGYVITTTWYREILEPARQEPRGPAALG
jgi:hypothetical protein